MRTTPDGYELDDDPARIQLDVVHAFLTTSYWSPGIARDVVERAARHSLVFGIYAADGAQVGYARVVTDRATFGWLADVFVLPEHRGRGLAKQLVDFVLAHPDLQRLRRFLLGTADAHGLYARFGFEPLEKPERFLSRSAF